MKVQIISFANGSHHMPTKRKKKFGGHWQVHGECIVNTAESTSWTEATLNRKNVKTA